MARHTGLGAATATPTPTAGARRTAPTARRVARVAVGIVALAMTLPVAAYAEAPARQDSQTAASRIDHRHGTDHRHRAATTAIGRSGGHSWHRDWRDDTTPGRMPTPTPKPTTTTVPQPTSSPTVAPKPTPKPTVAPTTPPVVPPSGIPTSFPDASTTGPRDGHALAPSGSLTITQPGTVVADLYVDGCIDVKTTGVTITDVVVNCSRATTAINVNDGATATIQYTEINGNGVVSAAVGFSGYTLSHVDIHSVKDGPRMNSNVQVLDSWIHGLVRTSDSHNDALQTTGGTGIVVRGNTLQPFDGGDPMNAAIMIGSENQPLRNVVIENNYLDGGNYTILARADLNGGNIVVRNNVFTRHFRYGPYRGASGMSADSTNVFADTR